MIKARGYAAHNNCSGLVPFSFEREEPQGGEILIEILYCGICHADIHQYKNDYGSTQYPFVPGHEIIGRVKETGKGATKYKKGDWVGVGYFKGSCGHCTNCLNQGEQFCENGILPTQNGKLPDGSITMGGYTDCIVVHENFVFAIHPKLRKPEAAPLLCAGVTTYCAFQHNQIRKGRKVAIICLGGLGHMAVKFGVSFGAEVSVLSSSYSKEQSSKDLGAHNFIITTNQAAVNAASERFDFIIDTVSALHNYNMYMRLLKRDGTFVVLGIPSENPKLDLRLLTSHRRKITGSFVGSIEQTKHMLDYCVQNNITADVEVIPPDYINTAYERTRKNDVKYRFVIDMKNL